MFSLQYPVAWSFHRNTSRWSYNMRSISEEERPGAFYKEYPNVPVVMLPPDDLPDSSLKDAMNGRHSCRDFSNGYLNLVQVATILKAGYGVNNSTYRSDYLNGMEFFERPVPSGGGLYPLELYLLANRIEGVNPGIYHYAIHPPLLEQVLEVGLPRSMISTLFMGQPYVAQAAMVVILTAIPARSLWKYGDRGYRYILIEAGHVVQNINLAISALKLGSVNLGGFFDDEMVKLLDLNIEEEVPIYGTAVGIPL
jgi:SagB-type dehydrogenase family enzyme